MKSSGSKSASLFVCPVCGGTLFKGERSYFCDQKHCYDIASDQHVNLLLANKKNSLSPGDDKEMVRARRDFLQKDYYLSLKTALQSICAQFAKHSVNVLDAGCGEGYYTSGICNRLQDLAANIYGVDISKYAVQLAAKAEKSAQFAVASVFGLPFADKSFDIILNCFSPLCIEEYARVLKPNGYFIYVVPAPRHLWQLKCAVYREPYENERILQEYTGFSHCKTFNVKDEIFLPCQQDIQSLFGMTPYVWKTSKDDKANLLSLESLTLEIEFDVYVYQKI